MAFEHKPYDRYSSPVNPDQCKASVPDGGRSMRDHQCHRKPWRDGWCKQHHPDTEAERREESSRRWELKHQHSSSARLGRALTEIEELKARIAELEDALRVAGKGEG